MKRKLIDLDEITLDRIKVKAAASGKSPKRYIELLVEEDSKVLTDVSAGQGYKFSDTAEPSVRELRAIMFEAAQRAAESNRTAEEEMIKNAYGKR